MWLRVLPSNSPLVESAFQVLSVHGSAWSSALDFKFWLQNQDDRVYYFAGDRFQLVVGFRSEGGGRWRGTIAGMSGERSLDAVRELFGKAMSFARERNATEILARVRKFPPSDPLSKVVQYVVGFANGYAEIEGVGANDQGRYFDYAFKLRSAA